MLHGKANMEALLASGITVSQAAQNSCTLRVSEACLERSAAGGMHAFAYLSATSAAKHFSLRNT